MKPILTIAYDKPRSAKLISFLKKYKPVKYTTVKNQLQGFIFTITFLSPTELYRFGWAWGEEVESKVKEAMLTALKAEEQTRKKDIGFIKELLGHLEKQNTSEVKLMLNHWLNELEKRTETKNAIKLAQK